MIRDAKNNKFDLIITKEISRFSRCTLDSIKYTKELLEWGVGVYFQSDNIITLYGDSQLRLTIMSSIAQDEVRRLSERVKFGIMRAYDSGKILGSGNIYGYNKIKGKLVINKRQAEFVKALFEVYSKGCYGYRTLAKLLTEKGYYNQKGKALNPGSLKRILTNPKYKGYYHGRITESTDYLQKRRKCISLEHKLFYKDSNIPPIVTEDLWNKCNEIIALRSNNHKRKSSLNSSNYNMIECIGNHILENQNEYKPVVKDLIKIYKKVKGD